SLLQLFNFLPYKGTGTNNCCVTMTQSGRQQFDFILEYRKQVFLKTGLGWFEDQVACGSGTTKEEDGFRREVVNSSCHSHSQVFTGDFKHFKCDLVALDSCIIDYLGCKILERIVGQDTIYTIVFCKQFECSSLHSRSRAIGLKVTKGSTSARSEEHTSELQSRENLVCRLL